MKRSSLLAVIALVGTLGCLDTSKPTDPVPQPAPEDPGEFAPTLDGSAALGSPTPDTLAPEPLGQREREQLAPV